MSLGATKMNPHLNQRKFRTRVIQVGSRAIGGDHPIAIQSMTTTDTMDVEKTVKQVVELVEAGCEIVRITAPTVKDAEALGEIRKRLNQMGLHNPLVADIHFMPKAALIAADHVEKVRINPGNFADRKMFKVKEYTDEDYQSELDRIHDSFKPLVLKLKEKGRALRIGTNHGSLSDRIMNRFGDSPEGMVESAFEYAEICRLYDFHNFCFSMKASNVSVMVEAYRLLVRRQMEKGWDYPIHLGVTEAGDGEDARLKSAIGIGTLLQEGIGDTIRVSLTENPVREIPVARLLADTYPKSILPLPVGYDSSQQTGSAKMPPEVWLELSETTGAAPKKDRPDVLYLPEPSKYSEESLKNLRKEWGDEIRFAAAYESAIFEREPWNSFIDYWISGPRDHPKARYFVGSIEELKAMADIRESQIIFRQRIQSEKMDQLSVLSTQAGAAFVDLSLGGLMLGGLKPSDSLRLAFGVLQATRRRMSKTEYIACPSCGRTLFDLEETTAKIRAVTGHLKGVKIAVMGCIVNGPGEMADADFGYVGGAPGRVNLYVQKDCVQKNIPSVDAPARLVQLIKDHDRWIEPEV